MERSGSGKCGGVGEGGGGCSGSGRGEAGLCPCLKVEWGLSEGDVGPVSREAENGFPVFHDFGVHAAHPGDVFLPGFEVVNDPNEV